MTKCVAYLFFIKSTLLNIDDVRIVMVLRLALTKLRKTLYLLLTMRTILLNFSGTLCDGYLDYPYLRLPTPQLHLNISK